MIGTALLVAAVVAAGAAALVAGAAGLPASSRWRLPGPAPEAGPRPVVTTAARAGDTLVTVQSDDTGRHLGGYTADGRARWSVGLPGGGPEPDLQDGGGAGLLVATGRTVAALDPATGCGALVQRGRRRRPRDGRADGRGRARGPAGRRRLGAVDARPGHRRHALVTRLRGARRPGRTGRGRGHGERVRRRRRWGRPPLRHPRVPARDRRAGVVIHGGFPAPVRGGRRRVAGALGRGPAGRRPGERPDPVEHHGTRPGAAGGGPGGGSAAARGPGAAAAECRGGRAAPPGRRGDRVRPGERCRAVGADRHAARHGRRPLVRGAQDGRPR